MGWFNHQLDIYIYMYIYIYMCIYIHTYICKYKYIHIHICVLLGKLFEFPGPRSIEHLCTAYHIHTCDLDTKNGPAAGRVREDVSLEFPEELGFLGWSKWLVFAKNVCFA